VEVRLDPDRSLREQPELGHNRWSPELEPIASVEPGDELTLELRDSMDGQVTPGTTDEELLELKAVSHVLTGPVEVVGADPGDLLELDILGYTTADFGWTAVLPGAGLLGDLVERPSLVRWRIAGGLARSDDLPGIAVAASTHAGVIGVGPSPKLVGQVLRRESVLADAGRPVRLPDPETAFPGRVRDGLRTIPPRENGGNLDVRDLTAGARLLLPVHVPGGLLSAGDLHFAQGDGEVSLYAIETSGSITVRAAVRKRPHWLPRFPAYEAPPRPPRAVFATTGIPLTDHGENRWADLNLAARRALLELIAWLRAERGYDFGQAYALASVACELRISQVVDVPNVLVSAALPLDVFSA